MKDAFNAAARNSTQHPEIEKLFFKAVSGGDMQMLGDILARYPAAMDWRLSARENKPAIVIAVEQGKGDVLAKLLSAGADANAASDKGTTALIYAANSGDSTMASALIAAGANTAAGNESKTTPLMAAAWSGNAKLCKLLIKHGANVNTQDSEGMTALMFAGQKGSRDVVQVLIDNNTDKTLENVFSQDFAAIVEEFGFTALARLEPQAPEVVEPTAEQPAAAKAPKLKIPKKEESLKEMVDDLRANAQDVARRINTPAPVTGNEGSPELGSLTKRLKKAGF